MNSDSACPEPALPATYGGPGFVSRSADHGQDVAGGLLWRRVGVSSEWGRLREVVLSAPSVLLDKIEDPERWHMLARPDRAAIAAEVQTLARVYASEGIGVHVARPGMAPPPNFLFMRDLVFTTPWGCVVGRPAAPVRAGESRFAQGILAELGVPLLGVPTGGATFEGADALWLDAQTVLVGVGRRTNDEGCAWLARLLADQGVRVVSIPLPLGVQHLLGIVVFVDRDLALIDVARAPDVLLDTLKDHELVGLQPSVELREKRSMNVVTLGPRRVVMPAGCPDTRRTLEAAGIVVRESPMSACRAAAGAMGCMTAVLRRDG